MEDFPPPFHTHKRRCHRQIFTTRSRKKPARPTSPHFWGDLKKGKRRVFFFFPVCQFECCRLDREREEGGTVGARQPRFCAKKRGEWITLFVQRRGKGRKEVSGWIIGSMVRDFPIPIFDWTSEYTSQTFVLDKKLFCYFVRGRIVFRVFGGECEEDVRRQTPALTKRGFPPLFFLWKNRIRLFFFFFFRMCEIRCCLRNRDLDRLATSEKRSHMNFFAYISCMGKRRSRGNFINCEQWRPLHNFLAASVSQAKPFVVGKRGVWCARSKFAAGGGLL